MKSCQFRETNKTQAQSEGMNGQSTYVNAVKEPIVDGIAPASPLEPRDTPLRAQVWSTTTRTSQRQSHGVSTGIVLCNIRCGTYTTGPLVVDPFAHVTPYHVHGCVDDIHPLLSVQYGPPVDR